MTHDLRYAIRTLRGSQGFAVAVILCLSLGIGANTAIFSLLDAALLRALPVGSPDELVVVQTPGSGGRRASSFSYPSFAFLRERAQSAAELFAYGRISINLSGSGVTDVASGLNALELFRRPGAAADVDRPVRLIAHGVQRRTREIGIRMSLGARQGVVLWTVLRESLALVAPGLCLGGVLSFWLLRMLTSQLFDISPADPAIAAGATILLVVVAAFTGYVPARRASRLDPAVALRHE